MHTQRLLAGMNVDGFCATGACWWMHSERVVPGMRMGVPRMRTDGGIEIRWRQGCALVCQGYILVPLLCQRCVWCAMVAHW